MNQPTVHFTETMRGQGALIDSRQVDQSNQPQMIYNDGSAWDGNLSVPENAEFVYETFQPGLQGNRAFPMEWRDLVVSVNTKLSTPDGGLSGTIDAGTIQIGESGSPPVRLEKGYFSLLPATANEERRMRYHMYCRMESDNRIYLLYGFKKLAHSNRGFLPLRIWKDTTTLHVTIYELTGDLADSQHHHSGASKMGKLVATGVIYIHLVDFLKQLTTFKSSGTDTITGFLSNYGKFANFFMGAIRSVYFKHLPVSAQVESRRTSS